MTKYRKDSESRGRKLKEPKTEIGERVRKWMSDGNDGSLSELLKVHCHIDGIITCRLILC